MLRGLKRVAARPAARSALLLWRHHSVATKRGGSRKDRVESAVAQILEALDASSDDPKSVPVGLKSPAADITSFFYNLSKNDFKGGISALFNGGFIRPSDGNLQLLRMPTAGVAEVMAADNHAWHQKQRAKAVAATQLENQRQASMQHTPRTRAALAAPSEEAQEKQRQRGERLRKKAEALALGPLQRRVSAGEEGGTGRESTGQQSVKGQQTITLFLGNLSYECQEADIRHFLSRGVGAAAMVGTRVRVGRDRTSGDHRGFAHAEFPLQHEEAARRVWDELHGQKLLGRPVIVDTV